LTQVKAVNTQDKCFFFSWCMPGQYAMFEKVLLEHGYESPHSFTWYKSNQNVKGTNFPNREAASEWNVSRNPMKRHNIIIGPSLKMYWKKDGTEEPLNLYEKPGWVAGEIAVDHLKPGSTVVVPGAGAGGTVTGLLNRGMNVYAFERDPDQWSGLMNRLHALANHGDEAIDAGDVVVLSDYEVNCVAPTPRLNVLDLLTKIGHMEDTQLDNELQLKEYTDELAEERVKNSILEKKLNDTESLRGKMQELSQEAGSVGKSDEDLESQTTVPESPAASLAPVKVVEASPAKDPDEDEQVEK
jgi:hypothetical protein